MFAVQQRRQQLAFVVALSSGDDDGDVDAEAVAVDWDLTERPSDGWENAATSSYSMMFDTEDDKCEEQWKLENDTHRLEKHRGKKEKYSTWCSVRFTGRRLSDWTK